MKLTVLKPFDWAHEHVRVQSYQAGESIETEDADLIAVAIGEKWAEESDKPKRKAKAHDAAPENKS
jgi:hypothetical protein